MGGTSWPPRWSHGTALEALSCSVKRQQTLYMYYTFIINYLIQTNISLKVDKQKLSILLSCQQSSTSMPLRPLSAILLLMCLLWGLLESTHPTTIRRIYWNIIWRSTRAPKIVSEFIGTWAPFSCYMLQSFRAQSCSSLTYLAFGCEVLLGTNTEVTCCAYQVFYCLGEHSIDTFRCGPWCRHDTTRLKAETRKHHKQRNKTIKVFCAVTFTPIVWIWGFDSVYFHEEECSRHKMLPKITESIVSIETEFLE